MPNTEVKLQHADSSWGIAPCEDRTLPRERKNPVRVLFFIVKNPENRDNGRVISDAIDITESLNMPL
ncbi:hypothetical protein, partial [Levilactobacillus lindianensis]|uniref:hypothetical protein n=1 Tax=Levilactobacillus lindianensis TaxID=2486018 RepID=UPI001CDD29C8